MLNTERLIRLRNEKKLIQEELAKILGVGRTTYVKYEKGDIQPPTDIVSKLADFFGVSVDYLLGRTNTPKTEQPLSVKTNNLVYLLRSAEDLDQEDQEEIEGMLKILIEHRRARKHEKNKS